MKLHRRIGLAIILGVFAAMVATQCHAAEMLSCHGVYGWEHPTHQLAMEALMGLIATLGAILFLA